MKIWKKDTVFPHKPSKAFVLGPDDEYPGRSGWRYFYTFFMLAKRYTQFSVMWKNFEEENFPDIVISTCQVRNLILQKDFFL